MSKTAANLCGVCAGLRAGLALQAERLTVTVHICLTFSLTFLCETGVFLKVNSASEINRKVGGQNNKKIEVSVAVLEKLKRIKTLTGKSLDEALNHIIT